MRKPSKPRPRQSASLRERSAELLELRQEIRKLINSKINPARAMRDEISVLTNKGNRAIDWRVGWFQN